MIELKIDPEFQGKIPPLTADEYEQLKENILEAGEVYEPIVTWNGVIVDGHNRWKIIKENPGLIWKTKEIDFPDKWAAFDWMYKNQLGRRNLTEQQRAYMIGKMYEARKKSGGVIYERNEDGSFRHPQNGGNGATDESIASELGIGRNTVGRNANYAKGIDAIKEVSQETADKILSGQIKPTREDVATVAKADPAERQRMIEQIKAGEKVTPVSVPDKIVDIPDSKYKGGGTKEYRSKRDEIAAIVASMYDPNSVPEYDVNELLKEIGWSAEVYIRTLRNTICDHRELATANRATVEGIIDEIKADIEKIKEEMDK